MIKEAIVLAGGLGTRLRSVVADLPKCMAPVNGIPFLHFIIAYLKKEGITDFIFSLGYKNELITGYLDKTFAEIKKKYIIETEQLGTGGAIKKACGAAESKNVLVVNGDTLFNINISSLAAFHERSGADCTLALKTMARFSRYGSVELDADNIIKAFNEKQFCEEGYINGGVYALNIHAFLKEELPGIFSFEKEYLEKNAGRSRFYGMINENYFIDIGIPEDYLRFQQDYNHIMEHHKYPDFSSNKTASLNSFFELLD